MAEIPLFSELARERVAKAVARIERGTSAELVVRVRSHSGHYRHTDYLVGVGFGSAALVVFLFHPTPFPVGPFPAVFALSFVLGVLLSASVPPLRRALTSGDLIAHHVRMAARAAFVDDGIGRTRDRTGILVYVSLFERRVEIVHDSGVDAAARTRAFIEARRSLEGVLLESWEVEAFEAALLRLGPPLAEALPRAADDVNELADEVRS